MERDYIKRTDAIEVLNIIAGKMDDDGQAVMKQAADIIRDVVPADVREVVHARWIAKDGQIICSKCNAVKPRDYNCLDNFCSGCGAKMDKEEHHEQSSYDN